MIVMTSWSNGDKIEEVYNLPDKVTEVEFYYDGGRLSFYINGEQVFYTALAGNDCNLKVSGES
jgi:hypothetical protein